MDRRVLASLVTVSGCAGLPYDERVAPDPGVPASGEVCAVGVACDVDTLVLTAGTGAGAATVVAWVVGRGASELHALAPADDVPCGEAGWRRDLEQGEAFAPDGVTTAGCDPVVVVATFDAAGRATGCAAAGEGAAAVLADEEAPGRPGWVTPLSTSCRLLPADPADTADTATAAGPAARLRR